MGDTSSRMAKIKLWGYGIWGRCIRVRNSISSRIDFMGCGIMITGIPLSSLPCPHIRCWLWNDRDAYYPRPKISAHPKDCSVMTYRGHQVLRTLIRCNFSPAETTGSQYLYSGSSDGKIHVRISHALFFCLTIVHAVIIFHKDMVAWWSCRPSAQSIKITTHGHWGIRPWGWTAQWFA